MSTTPVALPAETSQTVPPQRNGHIINGERPKSPLPKLPLPKLEDSCKRYLRALEGLQSAEEHERTKGIVHEFLTGGEGEKWQKKLQEYNEGVESYIEEFWCEPTISGRGLDQRRVSDEPAGQC